MPNEVPTTGQAPAEALRTHGDGVTDWVKSHAAQIDQYNEWVAQREPYSRRVQRWRASVGQLNKAD